MKAAVITGIGKVTIENVPDPTPGDRDVIVKVDPRYFRPTEVESLLGDPSKAKAKLGWTPEITVQEMCAEMVLEDLKIAKRLSFLKANGHEVLLSTEN